MEKTKGLRKSEKITEVISSKKAKYIIGTALLALTGIALPKMFHILAGSSAGAVFLPMHIAVLVAALTFGIISATVVGGTSVIASYLLTGMPTLSRLPYMLIELVIYAILLGVFKKKFNNTISLLSTVVLGRILYAAVIFVSTTILGLSTYGISVLESTKIGVPGIVLQLLCIPFLVKIINERLNLKNE